MLILLNGCYGGFGIDYKYLVHATTDDERTDPVIIALFLKYDDDFSGITLKHIPDKYRDYYSIREYDGLESLHIDYTAYKLNKIKKLADQGNTVSSDVIQAIYNENDSRSCDVQYQKEIAALPNVDELVIEDIAHPERRFME